MSVYSCGCLNVKIHTRDIHPLDNIGDDGSQPFLGRRVAEAMLDDKGIVIEQSYLLHRQSTSSGWVQYQCVNCNWRTHAVRTSDTRSVLINLQLESDPSVLLRLTRSPDFSFVYHIVMQNHNFQDVPMPDGSVYESLASGVSTVEDQADNFVEQEQSAMEERIRNFEHEQRTLFGQLQARCDKEKAQMLRLLMKAVNDVPQSDRGDNSGKTSETSRSPRSTTNPAKSSVGGRSSAKTRCYSEYDQNPDSEALFYLDELEPELEEPFYESDDDVPGKLSESSSSHNRTLSGSGKTDLYSTSVPISVPMWRGRRSSSTEEEEEEEVTPADPDQMAANMQALAQSITDTGRYIFGERPRPRLNTGDAMTRYAERPRQRLNTTDSVSRRK
ncbi:uncharacterized protein LOC124141052 [Haliotis rufescens]|uniref:uncharacterized protein LOC124141052 n=1 Tax=Haliotis rufescens TaxID=6454 RepID=UPI001EB0000F|nr:uncharacterized protein LOC124141052 [Haliotis rufescens]XP_046364890.1 uncharacterized protein LOC124141052 [Haliotis rufescens]XP_048242097.1 uncharacterized protein LOC124141052 [Haliotis rufescens]